MGPPRQYPHKLQAGMLGPRVAVGTRVAVGPVGSPPPPGWVGIGGTFVSGSIVNVRWPDACLPYAGAVTTVNNGLTEVLVTVSVIRPTGMGFEFFPPVSS